ncbi:hypothetical protein [Photobacterium nomapromontoriensis]|uniref:hypothetical protein n=1 Tax=Photobacterium nomapromontoriensis TaxID=2910237 RepID=UPI003D1022C0
MYAAIAEQLEQAPLSRHELNYLLGCRHAKTLQYYLQTMVKHGFIYRSGKHYYLTNTEPLMEPCARCMQPILTWAKDRKGRGKCCQPRNRLHIVQRAYPSVLHHSRTSRIMQRPFTPQAIADVYQNANA